MKFLQATVYHGLSRIMNNLQLTQTLLQDRTHAMVLHVTAYKTLTTLDHTLNLLCNVAAAPFFLQISCAPEH